MGGFLPCALLLQYCIASDCVTRVPDGLTGLASRNPRQCRDKSQVLLRYTMPPCQLKDGCYWSEADYRFQPTRRVIHDLVCIRVRLLLAGIDRKPFNILTIYIPMPTMMNATPDETPFLMIRRRRNWTPEEDMILKREVRRGLVPGLRSLRFRS